MALVAVDWGTSSLRGALLDPQGRVLAERSLPQGIQNVAPGGFAAAFAEAFGDWMRQAGQAWICGMAGSRQGWLEVPYAVCPAGLQDVAHGVGWLQPGRVAIVPGLSCEVDGVPDVMRGEETQVLGSLQLLGLRDATLVLPGTHSKWVQVQDGRIMGFRTCMTGEVYALLRRHSILARGMPQDDDGSLHEDAFVQGLQRAYSTANLLQAAFSARTLALFGAMPQEDLPSYLSGLVIGEELRSQQLDRAAAPVVVVAGPELQRRYALALQSRGVPARCLGSEAAWRGLWAVAQAHRA